MVETGSRDVDEARQPSHGRRLSVWIPADSLWMFDRLQEFVVAAGERGVPLSRSDVVRACLERGLRREGDEF